MTRAVTLAIAAAVALAGCGSSETHTRTREDLFKAVPRQTITAPADRAAPRWEPIARLRGSGQATQRVTVAPGAIQWRARWRCAAGAFAVSISPAPRSGPASAAGRCPHPGEQTWVTTGPTALRVRAEGRWRMLVEQEVDSALHEPPLASMRSPRAVTLASGTFYKVERKGRGSATLYRLPGGRLALRMAGFATDANTDLFVWLSEARSPRTTKAAFNAPHRVLAGLKSTLGDQNYVLPRRVDPAKVRSIVVWCNPVQIAYTAATLHR